MLTNLRHRALPLVGAPGTGSRDTCKYQCGDACSREAPNPTDNETFADVVAHVLSRRGFLKAGLSASVVIGTTGVLGAAPAAAAEALQDAEGFLGHGGDADRLTFRPILPTTLDDVVVPEGYAYRVLIRWGDPVLPGYPDFDFDNQTPEAQAGQFGYNCDYVGYFPFRGRRYREEPPPGGGAPKRWSFRGLLAVNHEYTNPELMFRDYRPPSDPSDPDSLPEDPSRQQVEIEMYAHGMSIIEIHRSLSTRHFSYSRTSRFNRRITAFTPMEITGPAAGHELLRTSADPTGQHVLGMLNNCAGGVTPWGTVLTGEENFDQYFSRFSPGDFDPEIAEAHVRYGLQSIDAEEAEDSSYLSDRGWELYHPRFNVRAEPHEPFRFGWVVEIDPFDPASTPRKRTALGRLKHEGAECSLAADGRVVSYMGDDQQFDYVYKFVSARPWVEGDKAANADLLDSGTLYVARFNGDSPPSEIDGSGTLPSDGEFDGGGEWIKLVSGDESFVDGFSAAEVLIKTRMAADSVGATKMDRPEDMQRNPVTGRVYINLTNNTARGTETNPGVDEANPRIGNPFGHVIEIEEAGGDATAETFSWRIFIQCGDPDDPSTYFAGFPKDQVSPISAPDNMTFDQAGNLWIATDGQPSSLGVNDAFHAVAVEGPERGRLKQFLSVVPGAEACGPCFTPDQETLFCAVQHPGDDGTIEGEGQVSDWPDRGGRPPRPSVVDIVRHVRFGDKRVGA